MADDTLPPLNASHGARDTVPIIQAGWYGRRAKPSLFQEARTCVAGPFDEADLSEQIAKVKPTAFLFGVNIPLSGGMADLIAVCTDEVYVDHFSGHPMTFTPPLKKADVSSSIWRRRSTLQSS
jgi:hypothetical protein